MIKRFTYGCIQRIVTFKTVLKDLERLTNFKPHWNLRSVTLYITSPKRNFSQLGMIARAQLTVLDFNAVRVRLKQKKKKKKRKRTNYDLNTNFRRLLSRGLLKRYPK